jgi:hypothetical protein
MTAVEWLMFKKALVGYIDDEMVEQALEIEKQQIIDAYDHYRCIGNFDNGIEYYNETYKKP